MTPGTIWRRHSYDPPPFALELSDAQALALAQFVKRITWQGMRCCAVDDAECEVIRQAIYTLRDSLAAGGYAPR